MKKFAERIQIAINYHRLQATRGRKMLECKRYLVPDPFPCLPIKKVRAEIRYHERRVRRLMARYGLQINQGEA